jgi:hypothetical protein
LEEATVDTDIFDENLKSIMQKKVKSRKMQKRRRVKKQTQNDF